MLASEPARPMIGLLLKKSRTPRSRRSASTAKEYSRPRHLAPGLRRRLCARPSRGAARGSVSHPDPSQLFQTGGMGPREAGCGGAWSRSRRRAAAAPPRSRPARRDALVPHQDRVAEPAQRRQVEPAADSAVKLANASGPWCWPAGSRHAASSALQGRRRWGQDRVLGVQLGGWPTWRAFPSRPFLPGAVGSPSAHRSATLTRPRSTSRDSPGSRSDTSSSDLLRLRPALACVLPARALRADGGGLQAGCGPACR